MKKLLTTIAVVSTLCMSTQALYADDHSPRKGPNIEKKLDRMADKLNLSEEQKKNIFAIKKAEFEQIKALREENRQKIEGYLTDEQKQMMKDRKKGCHKGERK